MIDNSHKYFYSLMRTLKLLNLSSDVFPRDNETWVKFLEHIDNNLNDLEQERYLLERSLEISSKEMLELNEALERAQNIAHIGYWTYNRKTKQQIWSTETYLIFGLNPEEKLPEYGDIIKMIYKPDRDKIVELIQNAFDNGINYEVEFRIIVNQLLKWVYVKTDLIKDEDNSIILTGIIHDVTAQKNAEHELKLMNDKLIKLSRDVGMSEVATSVLHNIGNVLNSVKTSVSVLKNNLTHYDFSKLEKISTMLSEMTNGNNKNPDKVKLIPEYLKTYSEKMTVLNKDTEQEINELEVKVNHIQDIVAMQHSISGIKGIKELASISEICNLAIHMCSLEQQKYNIDLVRDYCEIRTMVDKSKLLQILINLIKNAKDALVDINGKKRIIITTNHDSTQQNIIVEVNDNGIGIEDKNLTSIFGMGFTTKKGGHGFGLHASAIAAKELGGSLVAKSNGLSQGSTFILTIPYLKEGVSHE